MGGGAVLDQRFAAERPASGVDGTALGQAGKVGLGAAQQAVFLQQIVLIFAEQQLAVMQVGDGIGDLFQIAGNVAAHQHAVGIFGKRWDTAKFDALVRRFELDGSKKIKEYSRGMRMKLNLASALAHRPELLVLDEATSGLDPAARSEILDILLDFIQDEHHSVLLSSHITTDLEQIADTIAYLHHGQLLFAKNKDDLMEEYGILRCSQQDLDRLPPEWIAATCRTAAGCESLVHPRISVLRALPGAVCDAASIDDIMRLTSKEG